MYDYMHNCNVDRENMVALNYFGKRITFAKLFENINKSTQMLVDLGLRKGDTIGICMLVVPEIIYLFYAATDLAKKLT